jgi:hypothetical protein
MTLTICEHIKMDGERCGSPTLTGSKHCHYHAAMHRLVPQTNLFVRSWNPAAEIDQMFPYRLPFLEDEAALQVGLMQLIHGVVDERIDIRRARLVMSAMDCAAKNLRQVHKLATTSGSMGVPKRPATGVKTANGKSTSAAAVRKTG